VDNVNKKPAVLAVGLFVPGAGFTRVFESIFARLHQWFDIHWLGIAYKGEKKFCLIILFIQITYTEAIFTAPMEQPALLKNCRQVLFWF
jgi:hypothetical protein